MSLLQRMSFFIFALIVFITFYSKGILEIQKKQTNSQMPKSKLKMGIPWNTHLLLLDHSR